MSDRGNCQGFVQECAHPHHGRADFLHLRVRGRTPVQLCAAAEGQRHFDHLHIAPDGRDIRLVRPRDRDARRGKREDRQLRGPHDGIPDRCHAGQRGGQLHALASSPPRTGRQASAGADSPEPPTALFGYQPEGLSRGNRWACGTDGFRPHRNHGDHLWPVCAQCG